eukprot:XP_001708820.1 Hypothetical protein GL50803_39475 [Giardia lamblia ATCC 50803]
MCETATLLLKNCVKLATIIVIITAAISDANTAKNRGKLL